MLVSINEEEFETLLQALSASITRRQWIRDDYKNESRSACAAAVQSQIDKEYRFMDKLYKEQSRQSV